MDAEVNEDQNKEQKQQADQQMATLLVYLVHALNGKSDDEKRNLINGLVIKIEEASRDKTAKGGKKGNKGRLTRK